MARAMNFCLKKKNKKKRNARRSSRRAGLISRWLLLTIGFVVLGVQSFIVNPHFHVGETASLIADVETSSETNSAFASVGSTGVRSEAERSAIPDNEAPSDWDFSDCTMCKTAHQNGQYLRPTAAVFSLSPSANYRPIEFGFERTSSAPKSFSRQTRAPPQI